MLPCPGAAIPPNTADFENVPLVNPTGFREYDARWWFGRLGSDLAPELNLLGATALGLGNYLNERGIGPGRGYDDGLAAAAAVCDVLDRHPDRTLAALYEELPQTRASPTLSASCADEVRSSSSKAPCRMRACAPCSWRSTPFCAKMRKSATTTSRSERGWRRERGTSNRDNRNGTGEIRDNARW